MKRLLVVVVAIAVVVVTIFVLSEVSAHQRAAAIAAAKGSLQKETLPKYAAFLKPGMRRAAVYEELGRRGISFEQAHDAGHYNQIMQLKRLPSPVYYCSFEDVGIRIIFEAGGGDDSKATSGGSANDVLRDVDVYGQLMDCL